MKDLALQALRDKVARRESGEGPDGRGVDWDVLWSDIKRILRRVFYVAVALGILLAIGGFFLMQRYYGKAAEFDLGKLNEYTETNIFLDRNGREAGRVFSEDRTVLQHGEIPDVMRRAVIAVEDRRFYKHWGVDVMGLLRAIYINMRTGSFSQGGSTLTQQLAKNVVGTFAKTLDRKFTEVFLALRIESTFKKDQILDYYLNRIYFGKGYFGVEAAARGYFGKHAGELSLGEAAMLAGIVRSPNSASPRRSMEKAVERRNVVLDLMLEQKMVSSAEWAEAKRGAVKLAAERPAGVKSYFLAQVLKELEEVLALEEDDIPQGLRIHTTLDPRMQAAAEAELAKHLERIQADPGFNDQRQVKGDPLQGAAIVAEADDGAVRALVGGRDYLASPFDRVTMARRESGALIYPFLYALGVEKLNLHPASMINASFIADEDLKKPEAVALGDPDEDITKRFLTLQDALALSAKTCAIRVTSQLGLPTVVNFLRRSGAKVNETERDWTLSPMTLWEITGLYQALANHGEVRPLHAIEMVVASDGEELYKRAGAKGEPLLDPLLSKQMVLTLQSVVREGTGRRLSLDYQFPVPIAGTPGYSEGYRDAFFAGFTPSVVAGVWIGYDQSVPIGNKSLAARAAVPFWGDLVQKVIEIDPRPGAFDQPKELSKVEVDRRSGVVKGIGWLKPATGNIFVYLKQSQLTAAQREGAQAAARVRQSEDWSDWIGTLFASSAEGFEADAIVDPSDFEAEAIPPFAEYKIPGIRGDIITADNKTVAAMGQVQSLVLPWPALEVAPGANEALLWAQDRIALASRFFGREIAFAEDELLNRYKFQRFHPIPVVDALTPAEVERFGAGDLPKKGFTLQAYPRRFYPAGRMLSHTLGYLKRTQGRNRGTMHQADEVIYDDYGGASGLEAVFDKELYGRPGKLVLATTPDGFTQAVKVERQAEAGLTVQTTIDSRMQEALEKAIEPIRAGAVVFLDVNNGDIAALASRPDFDPNEFLPALPAEKWQELTTSQKNPLMHRVYRQPNPPGSTFKIVTALGSVQAGIFDPDRPVHCTGTFTVGNVVFRFPKETRTVTFREATAFSFNTYFMDLGIRVGRDRLIATARDFGVGRKTGFLLPDEHPGLMPDQKFVLARHGRNMGGGDVANASIGQGDVLCTPLQMALWNAAIANGGTLFRPRLVAALRDSTGRVVKDFPPEVLHNAQVTPEVLAPIRDAMVAVVQIGTGKRAGVKTVQVAGKTGTAQVGSKAKPRQIAWFSGFVPADQPRYAFAAMVEGDFDQDLHGGTDAAPIIGAVLGEVFGKAAEDPTPDSPDAQTD